MLSGTDVFFLFMLLIPINQHNYRLHKYIVDTVETAAEVWPFQEKSIFKGKYGLCIVTKYFFFTFAPQLSFQKNYHWHGYKTKKQQNTNYPYHFLITVRNGLVELWNCMCILVPSKSIKMTLKAKINSEKQCFPLLISYLLTILKKATL